MNKNRLLISTFFKQIFRDKKSSSIKKILSILVVYLLVNILLSQGYASTFDAASYTFISLTICLFFVGFVVFTDFQNIFLLPGGAEFMKSLPILQRDMFRAKFISSTCFTIFMIIFIIIPQTYFYSKYGTGAPDLIQFAITNILFSITVICLFLLLISFILKLGKKTNFFIISFQVIFFVFVFMTSTYRKESLTESKVSIFENELFTLFPQYLYVLAASSTWAFIFVSVFAITIAGWFYKYVSGNFNTIQSNLSYQKDLSGIKNAKGIFNSYFSFMQKILCRSNIQSSMFLLTYRSYVNSCEMSLRMIPVFTIPIVFALIGAIGNMPGFLSLEGVSDIPFRSEAGLELLSPTLSILFSLSAVSVIMNLKLSDSKSGDTSWIYDSITKNNYSIRAGAVKFFISSAFIPLFIILFAILSSVIDVKTVITNLFFLFSAIMLYLSVSVRSGKFLPFIQDAQKESSAGRMGGVFLSIIGGIIIFLVQIFVFQNVIFVIGVSLLFILAAYILIK